MAYPHSLAAILATVFFPAPPGPCHSPTPMSVLRMITQFELFQSRHAVHHTPHQHNSVCRDLLGHAHPQMIKSQTAQLRRE